MRHDLIFNVADALGLTLYEKGDDITGSMKQPVSMGPWHGTAHVYAQSDFVDDNALGMLVKLRKSLWGYVLSSQNGNTLPRREKLYLILFDGKAAGAKTGDLKAFCTGSFAATAAKIKPHMAKVFKFDGSWIPANETLDDLVGQVGG